MSGFLKLYFNARELAEQTKGLRRRHFDAIGHEAAHGVTEKNGGRAPAFGGTMNKEKIKDAFIGVSKKKIIDDAGGPHPYVDAFVGKASISLRTDH